MEKGEGGKDGGGGSNVLNFSVGLRWGDLIFSIKKWRIIIQGSARCLNYLCLYRMDNL